MPAAIEPPSMLQAAYIAAMSLIVACLVSASESAGSAIEIRRGRARLCIPQRYVHPTPSSQANIPGADSSEGSVLIRLPSEEVALVLPRATLPMVDFPSHLQIVDSADRASVLTALKEQVDEVNARSGRYENLKIVADQAHGFFRLYGVYGMLGQSSTWLVSRRRPPVEASDIVARCTEYIGGKTISCQLPTLVVGDVAVELTVQSDYLEFDRELRTWMTDRVQSWTCP